MLGTLNVILAKLDKYIHSGLFPLVFKLSGLLLVCGLKGVLTVVQDTISKSRLHPPCSFGHPK